MTEDQMRLAIPRRLDESLKFLFWDADVAMVFLFFTMMGIMSGFTFTLAGAGLVCAYMFAKAKSGRSRGYAMHLAYWHLPLTLGMKRTPLSARRDFTG